MTDKKFYVTYRWGKLFGGTSNRKAIECPTREAMVDCAFDIYSLDGIQRVYLNRSGRLPKGTTIISYEDYKNGNYHNL